MLIALAITVIMLGTVITVFGLMADVILPLWWALGATIPICLVSWWIAYRSDWF